MNDIPTLMVVLTVVFLLFWVFKALAPIDISNFHTDKSIDELKKKYMKYDLIQIGLLFIFTISLTFVYYYIFVWVSDLRISLLNETIVVVTPFLAAWFLSAMFTAMLTSTLLIMWLYQWYLKNDYDEYTSYGYIKLGFSPKVGSIVAKSFAVITAILVMLCLDWFTAFRQDDILINNLFGLGSKVYRYSDISDIRDIRKLKAPNGNIVRDEHYIIVFSDNSKWNSRQNGFGRFEENKKVIDWIELKTGKVTRNLEFDLN
jgi:hypothetical protein